MSFNYDRPPSKTHPHRPHMEDIRVFRAQVTKNNPEPEWQSMTIRWNSPAGELFHEHDGTKNGVVTTIFDKEDGSRIIWTLDPTRYKE